MIRVTPSIVGIRKATLFNIYLYIRFPFLKALYRDDTEIGYVLMMAMAVTVKNSKETV